MHPFSTLENTRKLSSGFLMFSGGKRKGVLGTNRLNELQSIPVRSQKSIISKFKKEKYTLKSELIELKIKLPLSKSTL